MYFTFAITLVFVGRSSAACIDSLLPKGHVQVNIPTEYNSKLDGPVVSLVNSTLTLFDTCLPGFAPPPRAYLLILNQPALLDEQVRILSCNHERWWPWVRTVVIIRNADLTLAESLEFSQKTINILWMKAVYNVVVYVEKYNAVFRADPFAKGNGCGTNAVNLQRGNCSFSHLPYRARFPNWCELHVSARDTFPFSIVTKNGFAGYDVKLAILIAQKSNLKIRWSSRPSQQTSSSSVAHAYYGNFSRNELDLAIGGSVLQLKYFNNVTYVHSHATQNLYFYVPDGEETTGWKRMFAVFPVFIWLSILFAALLTFFILVILGKGNVQQYFLMVLGLLIEQAVKLPNGRLSVVLVCVVLPFYYISSTYTIILHSYTMNPPISGGIMTLDQLLKANLTVFLSESNKLLTDQVGGTKIRHALKNSYPSPGLKEVLELMHKQRNFCLSERDIEVDVFINRNGYTIHNVDYKIATVRNAMIHPKGSKYANRIHDIVVRSIEAGILNKWMKEEIGRKRAKSHTLTRRAISWHDVSLAFVLLAAGHAVAFIVLFIEIFVYKVTTQTWKVF